MGDNPSRSLDVQPHEYSVVGHNRAIYARWLFTVASLGAAIFTAVGIVIAGVAKSWGLPDSVRTWLVAPLSAATVFGILHFVFLKWGWQVMCVFGAFPRITGKWACDGATVDDDGTVAHRWKATLTVVQDWEKIKVRLATAQSASYSVAASLLPDGDGAWTLMYSYRNEPRQGEPELKSHIGYCEMHFAADGCTAQGDYFNARGRKTAGRMTLKREA